MNSSAHIISDTVEAGAARLPIKVARLLCGIAFGSLALHAAAANAQVTEQVTTPADAAAPEEGEQDIVVTGTQLRGIAPVGTNVVTLSRGDIVATGATSANDILTKIPQVSSAFLSTPTAPPGGLSIIRPNIRSLGASGTNTTLVIVDGHRVVGAGVVQSTPDPDIIPPGVLERVDVVPDGGSSVYGSDAIGGVINFISRRKFDGLELIARHGFADNYQNTDVNVTAGKDWGSGSGYVSYSWAHNDAIFGRDRDYVRQTAPNEGYCGAGTIFVNTDGLASTPDVPYAVVPGRPNSTLTPNTLAPACDTSDDVSIWPLVTRHNVFASLSQEIKTGLTLDVRGYYADRQMTSFKGLERTTLNVTTANPYFQPVGTETAQQVRTNLGGIYSDRYLNRLTSYGITSTLTADLGASWQLRGMFNYGSSRTTTSESQLGDGAATSLNPYNLPASTQAQRAASVVHNFGKAKQTLSNFRVIADGSLFSLAGGDARLAIGAEHYKERVSVQTASPTAYGSEHTVPAVIRNRHVNAVFGEIAVPVIGDANSMGGIHALTLSASARYDDYSDVGGTFNPKVGLTFEPVDWVKIRGNWGKSFNAPALIDTTGTTVAVPVQGQTAVGQTSPWAIILIGNRGADVKPQTATTWSLGADVSPPVLPGLTLSATYFNIHMKREISLLAGQSVRPDVAGFIDDPVPCTPTIEQYRNTPVLSTVLGAIGVSGLPSAVICGALFGPNVALFDWRVQNLGEIKVDGIDFNVSYNRPVSFGTVMASVAGSYTLNRKRAITSGAAFVDTLADNTSRLALIGNLGAQIEDFTVSASVNHRSGYSLNPVIAPNPANPFPQGQDRVDSFTTVDLFLQYKLPEDWLPAETALTLNVTNLFDQDPPFYNFPAFGGNSGYTNGSTLGRFIQFGLRTKF